MSRAAGVTWTSCWPSSGAGRLGDVSVDPRLLEVLACPEDKGPLYYIEDEDLLYNPRLSRAYEVSDGIPIMLIEESRALDDAERARLDARVSEESIAPTFSSE